MQQICYSDKVIHHKMPTGEKKALDMLVNVINCREHNFERSELTDYFIKFAFAMPHACH